ncbi:MAG: ribosome maturation factor RimM, partial [Pseudomonadota bacterium]|nr:ribosome maturation factor RimM [Pseudomonadota bacterium]
MASRHLNRITVGRICGLFGVKGWVKVFSYTEPRENICRYSPWHLLGAQG